MLRLLRNLRRLKPLAGHGARLAIVLGWLALGAASTSQAIAKDLAAPPYPSVDRVYTHLFTQLDKMMTRTDMVIGDGIPLERGGMGRLYAWYWGYLGRASLLMHEATGEQRFLDLVGDTARRLLNERDDVLGVMDEDRNVIVPSWRSTYLNGIRSNEVTAAGLIALPMCQYALKTGDMEIGRKAMEALDFFLNERRQAHGGIYFWHTGQQIVEPLNHSHVYGAALAHCSLLPGAPKEYGPTALGIYRYWRHFTRKDGDGLSWAYMPAPDSPLDQRSEAIWKFGITIELPIALMQTGLLKDERLAELLAKTLTHNEIVKTGGVPQFIGHDLPIDISTREKFVGSNRPGLLSPVVMLDRPEVTETVARMVREHPHLFPRGWLGGSRTMIFAYAYLLANGALPEFTTPEG